MDAMRYDVRLPADYDMALIRRRVADRGHLTDDFPGLGLKAYCVSDAARTGQGNAYAPFYLWHDTDGMRRFLTEGPFDGIVTSFGRPRVDQWLGLGFAAGDLDAPVASATLEEAALAPDDDVREVAARERATAAALAGGDHVHSHAVALDTRAWQLVRLTLWTDGVEAHEARGVRRFEVLHLSAPGVRRLGSPACVVRE